MKTSAPTKVTCLECGEQIRVMKSSLPIVLTMVGAAVGGLAITIAAVLALR
ncbi:MAG: hypothetical protein R3C49_02815 [Planctomycetaceae bacterium]